MPRAVQPHSRSQPASPPSHDSLETGTRSLHSTTSLTRKLLHTHCSILPSLAYLLILSLLLPFIHCVAPSSSSNSGKEASAPAKGHLHHFTAPLTRLAFGSCNRQDKPQPLWSLTTRSNASAFVHLGDTVYADRHVPYLPFIRWPGEPAHIRSQYDRQLANPDYQSFLSSTPLLATWDDHDYGENDGDVNTPNKAAAQALFLDFLRADPADVRRTRPGVHTSYTFGPRGQRTKVILLDLRYFQDPGPHRDLLGPEQWTWLEGELDYSKESAEVCEQGRREGTEECDEEGRRIRPDLLFIGSSIQFGALQWGAIHRRLGEGWRHFPHSRQRLLNLLHTSTLTCPMLFLSGDVHYAELVRSDHCMNLTSTTPPTLSMLPILDITSSGLTHSIGRQLTLTLTQAVMPHLLGKPSDRLQHRGLGMDRLCTDLNFGLIDVDWVHHRIRVRILGVDDSACVDVEFGWDEVRRREVGMGEVEWPGWRAEVGGPHPMSTSASGMKERLARCEYERMEVGVARAHVSGLKGLVSLAAGVILLALTLVYFILRLLGEAVAWLLRRIVLTQMQTKKKQ